MNKLTKATLSVVAIAIFLISCIPMFCGSDDNSTLVSGEEPPGDALWDQNAHVWYNYMDDNGYKRNSDGKFVYEEVIVSGRADDIGSEFRVGYDYRYVSDWVGAFYSIGNGAFQNNSNFTKLTVGPIICLIDENSFASSKSLRTITIDHSGYDHSNSRVIISNYAFSNIKTLDTVEIIGPAIIRANAFSNCTIDKLILRGDVVIESNSSMGAFNGASLNSVTIDDKVILGDKPFGNSYANELVIITEGGRGPGLLGTNERVQNWKLPGSTSNVEFNKLKIIVYNKSDFSKIVPKAGKTVEFGYVGDVGQIIGDNFYDSNGNKCVNVAKLINHSFHFYGNKFYYDDMDVKFDPDGGSLTTEHKTVYYGKTYGTLPIPTKTGYTFNGWFDDSGNLVNSNSKVTPYKSHTLVAHWTLIKYTVTFNPNGGNVSPTYEIVNYGGTYGTLPTPTKTGYTFNGWYTSSSGGTAISSTAKVTSNHTIYAHWVISTYKITLSANSDDGINGSAVATYNSGLSSIVNSSRTGYSLKGYYSEKECTIEVVNKDGSLNSSISGYTDANGKWIRSGGATLYADWLGNTYTVAFDANGGSTPESKTVIYGGVYGTLPLSTKGEYKFDGWFTEAIDGKKITETSKVETAGNHTLYAHWTANTYTVTFEANGGSTPESKTVTYGETYGELPISEKTGYVFDGWFSKSAYGSKITSDTTVTTAANHTLYANWTEVVYEVTLESNTASMMIATALVAYGLPYGELTEPVYDTPEYNFIGWYTEKTGGKEITYDTIVTTAADHTLYAHWGLNTHDVVLNANSDGTDGKAVATYGGSLSSMKNASRTGYSPEGYYSGADCVTKVAGTDGSLVPGVPEYTDADGKWIRDVDTTLYAKWTANTYAAFFDANSGIVLEEKKEVTYGQPYGDLPVPFHILADYSFDGWFMGAEEGQKIASETIVTVAEDHMLYAHWVYDPVPTPVNYKITIVSAGNGTVTGGGEYRSGTYADVAAIPDSGYRFVSWSDGGAQYHKVLVDSDKTITATFDAESKYTVVSSSGSNGTIAPSGTSKYAAGETVTYTMTPSSGYFIKDVIVDGVSVGAVESYTFRNIANDHTISVSFGNEDTVELYVYTGSSGGHLLKLTVNGIEIREGSVTVIRGSTVPIEVKPCDGYYVDSIIIDGVPLDLTGDREIYITQSVLADVEKNIVVTVKDVYGERYFSDYKTKVDLYGRSVRYDATLLSMNVQVNKSDWNIDWTKYGDYNKSSGDVSLNVSYIRATYQGVLEVSFYVGEANNGKIATVFHKSAATGEIEELTGVVTNGVVTVNVDSLSPFLVMSPSDSAGSDNIVVLLFSVISAILVVIIILVVSRGCERSH